MASSVFSPVRWRLELEASLPPPLLCLSPPDVCVRACLPSQTGQFRLPPFSAHALTPPPHALQPGVSPSGDQGTHLCLPPPLMIIFALVVVVCVCLGGGPNFLTNLRLTKGALSYFSCQALLIVAPYYSPAVRRRRHSAIVVLTLMKALVSLQEA